MMRSYCQAMRCARPVHVGEPFCEGHRAMLHEDLLERASWAYRPGLVLSGLNHESLARVEAMADAVEAIGVLEGVEEPTRNYYRINAERWRKLLGREDATPSPGISGEARAP